MLWNIIFEFYVKYIFGGYIYGNAYSSTVGDVLINDSLTGANLTAFRAFTMDYGALSWGNYLSLIATLITMVAIVLICCALIKKIYNMCAHIIG